jgi:hypothetical protein
VYQGIINRVDEWNGALSMCWQLCILVSCVLIARVLAVTFILLWLAVISHFRMGKYLFNFVLSIFSLHCMESTLYKASGLLCSPDNLDLAWSLWVHINKENLSRHVNH